MIWISFSSPHAPSRPATRDAGAHASATADLWQRQVDELVEHVRSWAGNACEVLELTIDELSDAGQE